MVPWMSGPSTHQLIEVAGDLFGFHGWSGLADGPVEAAKDVSIVVNPGEFVSIIGLADVSDTQTKARQNRARSA